jgi:hypothetical protein
VLFQRSGKANGQSETALQTGREMMLQADHGK